MSIDTGREAAADRHTETPRDAKYLAKCLKAGMPLISADDDIPVRRTILFNGTLVDVFCIKEIVVATSHPSTSSCQNGGSCSSSCRNNAIFFRYDRKGGKGSSMDVRDESLIPELIARITNEIAHGTDTVINPDKMLRALSKEAGLRKEAERGAPSLGSPGKPSVQPAPDSAATTTAPVPGSQVSGFKLVWSDEPATAAHRVITWKGTRVDVRCVTRVEIISAAEMAEEYRTTGSGLPYCTDDVAVVRYSNSEVTGALYVEVLNPDLNDRLVEHLTREIQHGTDTLLDLYCVQWDLEREFAKQQDKARRELSPRRRYYRHA